MENSSKEHFKTSNTTATGLMSALSNSNKNNKSNLKNSNEQINTNLSDSGKKPLNEISTGTTITRSSSNSSNNKIIKTLSDSNKSNNIAVSPKNETNTNDIIITTSLHESNNNKIIKTLSDSNKSNNLVSPKNEENISKKSIIDDGIMALEPTPKSKINAANVIISESKQNTSTNKKEETEKADDVWSRFNSETPRSGILEKAISDEVLSLSARIKKENLKHTSLRSDDEFVVDSKDSTENEEEGNFPSTRSSETITSSRISDDSQQNKKIRKIKHAELRLDNKTDRKPIKKSSTIQPSKKSKTSPKNKILSSSSPNIKIRLVHKQDKIKEDKVKSDKNKTEDKFKPLIKSDSGKITSTVQKVPIVKSDHDTNWNDLDASIINQTSCSIPAATLEKWRKLDLDEDKVVKEREAQYSPEQDEKSKEKSNLTTPAVKRGSSTNSADIVKEEMKKIRRREKKKRRRKKTYRK